MTDSQVIAAIVLAVVAAFIAGQLLGTLAFQLGRIVAFKP